MEAFSKLSWLLCERRNHIIKSFRSKCQKCLGEQGQLLSADGALCFLNGFYFYRTSQYKARTFMMYLALCDVSAASLPLVSSVLISTEPSGQVEGAVGSQAGVHPLGEMEDLGWRESLPLTLLSLQPTLAATGRALLSAPEEARTLSAQWSSYSRGKV